MKWRHAVLYLLVFCVVGGYFFYFEIVKKEQKMAAEKEAKRLFRVAADSVEAIELHAKDKKPILLRKEGEWKLVEPVQAQADRTVVEDLVRTLANLEFERQVVSAAEDPAPYGLSEPSLKVRFRSGDTWMELLVGDKNPVGDGYFAKKADSPELFLIAVDEGRVLNRGVNDLRRKQLFVFEPENVVGMKLVWQDGKSLEVKRNEQGTGWEIAGEPQVVVKDSKVRNAVEQVQWLRAKDFPEENFGDLKFYGLDPPAVRVDLDLGAGRTAFLLVGQRGKEEKRVPVYSSELACVAWVDSNFLADLPKSARDLEDRSLVGVKPDEVQKADLRLGELRGQAVRMENGWGLAGEEGKEPRNLKEPWQVRSLLWDLNQLEYVEKVEPAPPIPSEPHGRIRLWSADRLLATMSWNEGGEKGEKPLLVWVEKDGNLWAMRVKAEELEKVEKSLNRILR